MPKLRHAVMKNVPIRYRLEDYATDTERRGRLAAMKDVTTMQRKELCVSNMEQSKRKSIAVHEGCTILWKGGVCTRTHRNEAEATSDRITILASRHFVVVVQERKELDKVITNNIVIVQYIYR